MRAHVLGRNGRRAALDVLPKEGGDLERCGLAARQVLHKIVEREAGIENVLDDQNVAAFDIDVEVLDDAHDTRRLNAVAIARHGHKVDIGGKLDLAHQIAHKDHGTAQHGDKN